MAEFTTNLNLFKPGTDDNVGVESSLDENFGKIDMKLGSMLKDLDGKVWETAGERVSDYQKALKTSQTDIDKLKKKNPNARLDTHFFRMIAHRGAKGCAPENTLMAYAYAIDMGYWGIETSIQLTSDNRWVCFQYDTIEGRSNGTGTIASKTLSQLKALDFGGWYDIVYSNERIPTIEEFFEVCRLGETVPYIEVEKSVTDVQMQKIVEIARDFDMEDSVVVLSPVYSNLQKIRYYSDYMALGYTRKSAFTQKDIDDTLLLGNAFINAAKSTVNATNMKMAIKARLHVEAHVIDSNNELRQLIRLGIRGAQSNEIPMARGY